MKMLILLSSLFFFSLTDCFGQGRTLLFSANASTNWNDPGNWSVPGQPTLHLAPTSLDTVLFDPSLSGIFTAQFVLSFPSTIQIGFLAPTSPFTCKAMHLKNTTMDLGTSDPAMAGDLNIHTANGGFLKITDNANLRTAHIVFSGNTSSANLNLEIVNSSFGTLGPHNFSLSSIYGNSPARINLQNSSLYNRITLFGYGQVSISNCAFYGGFYQFEDNCTVSVYNSSFTPQWPNDVNLNFKIGRNTNFSSGNLDLYTGYEATIITSGAVLQADIIKNAAPGNLYFDQWSSAANLPNIIDGNITAGEYLSVKGPLKVSGNFTYQLPMEYHSNIAPVLVNGSTVFSHSVLDQPIRHIEFFGATDSYVSWSGAFPTDTLILNKTGCAKLRFENSLYAAKFSRLIGGQLILDPNPPLPFKFVCGGNLEVLAGAGLFLRKNSQNQVAGMAIDGDVFDYNTTADSTCTGISNPYGGNITFFRNLPNAGNRQIQIHHPQGLPNLRLAGKPGSGFILASPLTVSGNFTMQAGTLDLNNQPLTIKPE